jgi:hypothetical protein
MSVERNADKLHALLRQIVEARAAALLPLVDSIGTKPLRRDEREKLRTVLAGELVEKELDEQDEPTARGLVLEDVIDWLGHR